MRNRGFSLIEILVALLVLSIGLLGVAAVLINMHKADASAYVQQSAEQYAYDMLDRMRSNQSEAINGGYNIPPGTASPAGYPASCSNSACSPTALAQSDKKQWLYELAHGLAQGSGSVSTSTVNGNIQVTVVVSWNDDPARQAFHEVGSGTTTYTLQTVL